MENKKWAPSQEENLGVITSLYELIKEELSELQKKTGCPDSFIYDFIGQIPVSYTHLTLPTIMPV